MSGSYTTARSVAEAIADRPELPVMYQTGGKASALVLELGWDEDVLESVYFYSR